MGFILFESNMYPLTLSRHITVMFVCLFPAPCCRYRTRCWPPHKGFWIWSIVLVEIEWPQREERGEEESVNRLTKHSHEQDNASAEDVMQLKSVDFTNRWRNHVGTRTEAGRGTAFPQTDLSIPRVMVSFVNFRASNPGYGYLLPTSVPPPPQKANPPKNKNPVLKIHWCVLYQYRGHQSTSNLG